MSKKELKLLQIFFSPRNCKKSSVTPLFFPGVDSYHSFCCCAEMTGQSAREEEKFWTLSTLICGILAGRPSEGRKTQLEVSLLFFISFSKTAFYGPWSFHLIASKALNSPEEQDLLAATFIISSSCCSSQNSDRLITPPEIFDDRLKQLLIRKSVKRIEGGGGFFPT